MYALTSFGLNATSQNLTTGDAYAVLKANGAPKQLTDFMLSSCVSNGVNSSVLDALSSAATALQKMHRGAANHEAQEQRRLKRVSDVSLRAAMRKKQRPMSPPVEMEAAKVKSLLAAAGLIKGEETVLHYSEMHHEEKFAQTINVVASCVAPTANDQARTHAMQAARAASRKGVLQALSSAICVLRACPGAKIAPAFVVRHSLLEEEDKIKFSRVLPCGGLEDCTPGVIVDTPLAVVLIVRMGKSVRVTGTVRG
jgi:cell envelope opacity-associated protein A